MTRTTTTQPQTPATPDPEEQAEAQAPEPEPDEPDEPDEPEDNADTAEDTEDAAAEETAAEEEKPLSESGEDADEGKAKVESKSKRRDKSRDEKADPGAKKPDAAPNPGGAGGGARRVAMVLTVVAALCAAWFGWSWYGAAHDESLAFSRERAEVLQAGEQAVQNLNTLDYRSLDKGLQVWQDSSTNDLYQQIVRGRTAFEKAVTEAKTITDAKVLDAAVTELDRHAGKARVIVALEITVTPPKGEPTLKKTRMVGQLTRTATGWKLSALGEAPTGTSR